MKSLAVIVLLAVALTSPLLAQKAIDGVPQARSVDGVIHVYWTSTDETGLVGYEVARGSGREPSSILFAVIFARVTPRGSNTFYDVIDETAFRTTDSFYEYRIIALYADGHRSDPYYVGVAHSSVSSVRRTWGSIKAMFR